MENGSIVAVEVPFAVSESAIPNVIERLGGKDALTKFSLSPENSMLFLNFRPSDPFSHPVHSVCVPTNDWLVKVRLPKRTSHLPLSQRLNELENAPTYSLVGKVKMVVRFRDMADFQWLKNADPFGNNLHAEMDEQIKEFAISCQDEHGVFAPLPPPIFSRTTVPHAYNYKQNSSQVNLENAGLATQTTTRKSLLHAIEWKAVGVPQTTPDGVGNYQHELSDALVLRLHQLFQERPIWTKRALQSQIPRHFFVALKSSLPYVCYLWANGPWKDSYAKLGVDPRSDPKYRFYQTLSFQLPNKKEDNEEDAADSNWHVFDGRRIHPSMRLLQLCDITDPIMQKLLKEEAIREEPDIQNGWYRASTMERTKYILRQKMRIIRDGKNPSDIDFVPLLEKRTPEASFEEDNASLVLRHASANEATRAHFGHEQLINDRVGSLFPRKDQEGSVEPEEYAILEEDSS